MSYSSSYQSGGTNDVQYVPVHLSETAPFDDRRSGGSSNPPVARTTIAAVIGAFVKVCFILAIANSPSNAVNTAATTSTAASTELVAGKPLAAHAAAEAVCKDPNYSSETLKLAHEMPVVALLARPEGSGPVFETSCILNLEGYFYAVSDDSPSIAKIKSRLVYNDPLNVLIPPSKPLVEGPQTEMGFEALFYDEKTETFTAVIEAVPLEGEPNKFHSMLYDLKIRKDASAYDVTGACPSSFEFISGNKGFEGAALVKNSAGEEFVLGLCEGNFCEGGKRGRTEGNGRLVLLRRVPSITLHGKTYGCGWQEVRVINLPESVKFRDYSAITFVGADPKNLRVAVASQENSQVWIAHMNIDSWSFNIEDAKIYDFPRDANCEIEYCNVEGLDFLTDNLLIAASDQMKNAGRQNARCLAKDQSIHIFVIPPPPEVEEDD